MEVDLVRLTFKGPFSFCTDDKTRPCIFHQMENGGDRPGVYFWAIRSKEDGAHYVNYVGQTTAISYRQRDHLMHALGLNYGIWDADKVQCVKPGMPIESEDVAKAKDGKYGLIWPGVWRLRKDNVVNDEDILTRYEEFHAKIVSYVRIIDIFFANTDEKIRDVTKEERKQYDMARHHIEGSIACRIKKTAKTDASGKVGDAYASMLYPHDNKTGRSRKSVSWKPHISFQNNKVRVRGLSPDDGSNGIVINT